MGGDEKQARHVLAEMQARLARSAYDALDINAGAAGPSEVRAAFLQLTKTFHPAKFARMSPEIQRLANEIFLGLRAAHDQLARPRTAPVRQSGQFPLIASKTPAPELTRPTNNASYRQASAPGRPNPPPAPSAAITPPTQPRPNPPPAPSAAITPPTQPRANHTRASVVGHSSQIRRVTPVGGVPVTPGSGPRPVVRPTPPGGVRVTSPTPSTPAPKVEPELAGVYDLLQRGAWEQARTTLDALIALQPKPRYRALLQYSRGREAQLSRRLDEARVDLQAALEIDPDLQLAKTALAELFTRRK